MIEPDDWRQSDISQPMKLDAYKLTKDPELRIQPAVRERDWMDETGSQFAYRCLPVNIANAYGWHIICPTAFTAIWDGTVETDAIRMRADDGSNVPANSHFGHGVLTFDIPYLFRTEPGFDLFVTGPINAPKHGIVALSGIVETDWAPYTFSMNWMFTRRSLSVRFKAGEPCCQIFPVRRGMLETVKPRLLELSDNPALEGDYRAWASSRAAFNNDLAHPSNNSSTAKWQKTYFRGMLPNGEIPERAQRHLTKMNLRPFQNDKS